MLANAALYFATLIGMCVLLAALDWLGRRCKAFARRPPHKGDGNWR